MDLSNFEDSGVRFKKSSVLWSFYECFSHIKLLVLAEVGWAKTRVALEKLSDPQQAETDFLKCAQPMLEHIAVRGLMFDVSTLIY